MIGKFTPTNRSSVMPPIAQLSQQRIQQQQPQMGAPRINANSPNLPANLPTGMLTTNSPIQNPNPVQGQANMFANAILRRDQLMNSRYPQPTKYIKDTTPYVPTQTTYNASGAAPNVVNSAYPTGFVPAKNPITGL